MTDRIEAYRAMALQTRCEAVNGLGTDDARAQMMRSIERIGGQIHASKAFVGPDVRLVVLPEYFLTGFPMGETIGEWSAKAALRADGREFEALAAVADDNGVFLAGNAYEVDPHFPDLYFQTSFLIDPAGSVVLRYRRLISMFAPTPHDVWDRYLEIYGLDGVFPVAQTELGRIAAVASEEILYPEVTRALALRGAEVVVHSTSEAASPALTPKAIARRARAFENSCYIVSANSAGIVGTNVPASSTDAMSTIVDFHGSPMCEAGYGETMVANAELDVAALRRWRRRPGMGNMLSRQRTELFADVYGGRSVHPANTMLDESGQPVVPTRGHFVTTQRAVIRQLIDEGLM